MYVEMNQESQIEVVAEDNDDCFTRQIFLECPLMAKLQEEQVLLRYGSILINDCELYKLILENGENQ